MRKREVRFTELNENMPTVRDSDVDYNYWNGTITPGNSEHVSTTIEAVTDAIKAIQDATNAHSTRDIAMVINKALRSNHRTLQGDGVDALLLGLSLYGDASYDGRNRHAVLSSAFLSEVLEDEGVIIPKSTVKRM